MKPSPHTLGANNTGLSEGKQSRMPQSRVAVEHYIHCRQLFETFLSGENTPLFNWSSGLSK